MPGKPESPDPSITFESAMQRLKEITEAMEGDSMPLSDLLSRYEEGTKLVKFCQEILNTTEQRIEMISRAANGEVQIEPFTEKAEPPAAETRPTGTRRSTEPTRKPAEDVSLF